MFREGQTSFIFPIFGPGLPELVKESTQKLSIFGDLLFIGFIANSITSKKEYQKGTWIAFAFVVIEFSVSFMAFVSIFDYVSIQNVNYPYHESIRYLKLGFLTNLETFFFPFWLVSSFVRFSFYLFLIARIFGWLFKMDQFEYIIPTLATIFIFIGMIPESPSITVFQYREALLNFTSPLFFLLPCVLWMTAKLKGDFKNANKTNHT